MSDLDITTNCLEANDRIHSNLIGFLRLLFWFPRSSVGT